jgi:hypothetical protein
VLSPNSLKISIRPPPEALKGGLPMAVSTTGLTLDILVPNNKFVHVSTGGGLGYGIYVSSLIYRILGNSDVLVKQFIRSFSGVAHLAWARLPSRPS